MSVSLLESQSILWSFYSPQFECDVVQIHCWCPPGAPEKQYREALSKNRWRPPPWNPVRNGWPEEDRMMICLGYKTFRVIFCESMVLYVVVRTMRFSKRDRSSVSKVGCYDCFVST
jgi:hypothetical protein